MKIGLWTGMFSRHCGKTEETIKLLKDCGFSIAEQSEIEFAEILKADSPLERAAQIHEYCEKCSFKLTQVHLPKLLTVDNARTDNVKQEKLEQIFEILHVLDIPVAVIHPLTMNDSPDASALNKDFFSVLVDLGNRYQIKIAAENLIGQSYDEVISILENTPGLGANLDFAHASSSQWDILESIKLLAPRLYGLHVSDNNGENYDLHLTPGKGCIKWNSVLQLLTELKYEGDFHMELPHERADDINETIIAAMKARETVSELFYAANIQ